jgi:CBS domain-containing protein
MTTTLKSIIGAKTTTLATVAPGDTIQAVLDLMSARKIGSVLVMEGQSLVGIVSERDLVTRFLQPGKSAQGTKAKDVMTPKPYCATMDQTAGACMKLMTEHRFRHLPVLDGQKRVVGIVSIGDLVKSVIEEQTFMIDQFERYVYSGGF